VLVQEPDGVFGDVIEQRAAGVVDRAGTTLPQKLGQPCLAVTGGNLAARPKNAPPSAQS
jgi:hypothetical protein